MSIRRAALAAALSVVFAAGLAACGNSANDKMENPSSPSMTQGTKTDDGKMDDGKTDDGKMHDGKTDDGKMNDGKTDDGKMDDGKMNDGKTDNGKMDDGKKG